MTSYDDASEYTEEIKEIIAKECARSKEELQKLIASVGQKQRLTEQ